MASVAAAAFEENRLSEERAVFQEQKKKDGFFTGHPRFIVTPPSPTFICVRSKTHDRKFDSAPERWTLSDWCRPERKREKKKGKKSLLIHLSQLPCDAEAELMKD